MCPHGNSPLFSFSWVPFRRDRECLDGIATPADGAFAEADLHSVTYLYLRGFARRVRGGRASGALLRSGRLRAAYLLVLVRAMNA